MSGPQPTTGAKGETTIVEPTRAQQLTGRRAAEAKATVPEFAVGAELDLEALAARLDAGEDSGPLLTAHLIRATALALREHPQVNAAYRDHRFERYARINVSVSVEIDDGVALPTIFDADAKPAAEIAVELEQLSVAARSGGLTAPQVSNGTFTVSHLQTAGVRTLTPILTPGQAAALAIGPMAPHAVVGEDGALAARQTAAATLVADQRIVSIAGAAAFLAGIRALLAAPDALELSGDRSDRRARL